MLEYRDRTVQEVAACICDRCRRRMTPDDPDLEWFERVSIAYRGGFGSIFGDGCEIAIDLCQHCVQDTLGDWLRVASPDLEPAAGSRPLSALKGVVQHDGGAVTIGAMNAAIAAGAVGSETARKAPDSDDT